MTTPQDDPLRARSWDQFIGQADMRRRLNTHIQAALAERRMLPHVLLAGPPGFGKTTLAQIIGSDLGDRLQFVTMPIDLGPVLRQWQPGGILFLDEIHRATKAQQEDLLPLLEPGSGTEAYIQLKTGGRLSVPHITVIGATTEADKIIPPLYDRFTIKPSFVDYSDEEMGQIVIGMADRMGLDIPDSLAIALGQATGGTPRNAKQLVFAARDLACSGEPATLGNILALSGREADGLTVEHLKYLDLLAQQDGRAALPTMSALLRLHPSTVRELERLLLTRGLVQYSPQGRTLTSLGYARRSTTPTTHRLLAVQGAA